MPYEIAALTQELVYIRWEGAPTAEEGIEFINAMHGFLNEAERPIYFLSDLRKGCITRAATLHKLTRMAEHPRWGGSVAFVGSGGMAVFETLFSHLTGRSDIEKEIRITPEEALVSLEILHPGLTHGIDWSPILGDNLNDAHQSL